MAHLTTSSKLAPDIRVVGTSLEDFDDDTFRTFAKEAVKDFGTHELTDEQWNTFASRLTYVPMNTEPRELAAAVAAAEAQLGPEVQRLHYLSVPPQAALSVILRLRVAELVDRSCVVMEKPFGTDLPGAWWSRTCCRSWLSWPWSRPRRSSHARSARRRTRSSVRCCPSIPATSFGASSPATSTSPEWPATPTPRPLLL